MGDAQATGPVLIASNRGPVSFTRGDDGRLLAKRGGGGVVSGLSAAADESDMLWVCAALGDGDRAAARAAPGGLLDPDLAGDGAAVRMLDIPPATFQRAYNAVANSTLWFVHHMLYDTPNRPSFGPGFARDWSAFRHYNEMFAEALADAARAAASGARANGARTYAAAKGSAAESSRRPAARAVIQDYHLCLAPQMLAERAPGTPIAHFSHTPWAPPDYYRMLPSDVGREVLTGILGADHAGFLCRRWADAFMDCCAEFLTADVDRGRGQVSHAGHVTSIGVHPLGVDAGQLQARAAERDVLSRMAALAEATAGRRLIVRVDRTELSKNIVRGLEAYREFLRTRPEWHGKVVHLAFAYPSRHDLPEYREYTAAVQRMALQIEDEFGSPGWDPLMLEVNDDYARSLAACRLADVMLVNPIRDGMNLVAKEGPILSDRGCALVLSTEAGAADELGPHALMVNPFDISQTAQALHEALVMSAGERERRGAALAAAAASMPPSRWLGDQLDALDRLPVV
ncbi:MAG TPA: trehalose-6-phosphate synthase [Streptosporangiaceae bacterium]|nr:trehalose-6-phosphate synthase [Streptosporangiaceae bacterium]